MSEQAEQWQYCVDSKGGVTPKHPSQGWVTTDYLNVLEAAVVDLKQQLGTLRAKAKLADEIRRHRRSRHTVYWWADYLDEFQSRYDALTSDTGSEATK